MTPPGTPECFNIEHYCDAQRKHQARLLLQITTGGEIDFWELASHEEASKNRIQIGEQVSRREDPQVIVNVSAVFSLWWCSGGCVLYMVSYGVITVLFSNFVTFSVSAVQKNMFKRCPRILVKNCVQETGPTHMSKKHVQQKPVPET